MVFLAELIYAIKPQYDYNCVFREGLALVGINGKWKSRNTAVATVDSNGKVTGVERQYNNNMYNK